MKEWTKFLLLSIALLAIWIVLLIFDLPYIGVLFLFAGSYCFFRFVYDTYDKIFK